MPAKLNQDQINELLKLRASGVLPVELCKIFSISQSCCYRIVRNSGIEFKNPRIYDFTEEQKAEMRSLYESGIGANGVAEKMGLTCAPNTVVSYLLKFYGKLRDRSEQQFARMAISTPEQIAKLTEAAHKASKGRKADRSEGMKRAKTMEGSHNRRSKWEKPVFEAIREFFPEAVPSKAVDVYNLDIGIGSVAVEIFGGGWSYTDKARVDKYIKRTKHLAELGYSTIFVVFASKLTDVFDRDNLVKQIQIASLDPSSARQYRVIWGDFNAASGLCSEIDHDAFICPFVNIRNVATGRYKRILR